MKLLIINGPNLNLLGKREGNIYGDMAFEPYLESLRNDFSELRIDYFQSNIEGEIIDKIQQADENYDGIIINPGGYTHTSVAIADAIRAISTPVVEVHITNLFAREDYRHVSLTGAACKGCITGFGLEGYRIAIQSFLASAEMRGV
jgi:3-dehydroquinate dehydratase II